MKGFKFKNQFVRFMLLVLVLSVAWAACSGSRETAEPGESASDNASDNALGYIMKHIEQGVTYQLDLSHPLQHQYVTDTLNGAGFNEETSPQSFAQLAATGNMKKELKPDDPKPAQPIPGLEFAPMHYISNFSVKGSEFSLTGLSTMPRGAPQTIRTHVLVTLLDQKGKVLTRESSDQFHVTPGGTYVSINVSGEIPEDKIPKEKEMLTANALFLIYPQDGGEPIAAYSKTASDQFLTYPQKSGRPTGANSKTEGDDSQVDTTAACMEKPICSVSCQNPPTCSNDDPGKKIIVCVNRDWITDCDEKVDNCCGFQVKGSMTFKNRLDTTSGAAAGKGTVTISLTMEQGGGYTLYSVSGNLDGAYFTLSGDEKEVLSWNFPKGTFSSGCGISGTYLSDFTMNISVTKADATGNQSGTFTSNTGQTGDDIYYVPKIDFLSGCFAAGTKILMADGS
ncbi:MAG: hypothetical protein GY950_33400, partial [bacterium]|nr:hypothetical protein [bacterium]